MKTNLLKSMFFAVLTAGILSGCVNDDDYAVPVLDCTDPAIELTKTVKQIKEQATTVATEYQGDDVIKAVVVSSDKGGNFYKTLYLNSFKDAENYDIDTNESDLSIGFSVQINQADLFTDYGVGRVVYIKLKGLYTQIRSNTLQIGALYNGNVGQIPAELYSKHVIKTCKTFVEESLVNRISLSDINDSYLGKLIEFDGVQFTDAALGQNFYNPANLVGSETNHLITDSEDNDNTLIFRTGQYAEYAGLPVPSNSGKIRGVLTKFNTDYQFVSRYTSDIMLTEDRIGGGGNPGPEPGESPTAVGGSDIQFLSSYTENFESYNPDVICYVPESNCDYLTFSKYITDAVTGPRYWAVTSFGGNKYIQMSAHNTNSAAKSYFILPVNFDGSTTLSFKTKDGYNNGSALKVYYSTDYTAKSVIADATLVDITSNFTIATGSTGGYAANFTNSGTHTITATGNGFIIFEYTGSHPGGVTTTMQIDDITIN
jgi:hypothetical protein